MFSLLNNKEDIKLMFSSELKNETGVYLAKEFLKKGGCNLERENLELMVRRGIFPNMSNKSREKLSLKLFGTIYNLTRQEMVNYKATQCEEWNIYGSNCDLIKVSVYRNKMENERIGRRSYIGLPTYFPCYLRSTL